jgi:hypothetical protein
MRNIVVAGIDPGPIETGVVAFNFNNNYIVKCGVYKNEDLLESIENSDYSNKAIAIEQVASYGMPVGKDVFETVYWTGRFAQAAIWSGADVTRLTRHEIKMHVCKSARAKDSNIRQALIDRFGEPGTKKNPGVLYGVKSHIWPALAVAVTYWDKYK